MSTDAQVNAPAGASPEASTAGLRRNPRFLLGVNYYPLDADAAGWEEWYTGDIDTDFAAFAEARLTLVRVFVSWKCFEPQVGRYSEEAGERFDRLVRAAASHRLRLIVCFFADDRHADLTGVVWGQKRDPRTDSYLIERETALVSHIVERHSGSRAIFAWELANEAFCCGFDSADALDEWAGVMRETVRELDPERPVMLGADPETLFHATRVDARDALEACEIDVSHQTARYRTYLAEGPLTVSRSTYVESFLLHAASRGRPVLLDDVGAHTLEASHAEEALALRCSLYSALMNGASGALVRRWRDMATERREPFHIDHLEALVGVADTEGQPKAAHREIDAFSVLLARLDLRDYTRVADRAAVVMPSERTASLPALSSLYGPRACFEAYVRATEAHVPVTVVREADPFDPLSVVIVPSVTDLAAATWERLTSWVKSGGTLVYSYGGGEFGPDARELFGVDFLGHGGVRQRATCRVAQQDLLGAVEPFDVAVEVPHFALVGPRSATVVATDSAGSPLATVGRHGQGRAIFIAAPFERVLGQSGMRVPPEEIATFLRAVYGAAADGAGCGPKVACDQASVELSHLTGEDHDVLILLNHVRSDVTATLRFGRRVASVADVRGGDPVPVGGTAFGVPLGGFGATALRLYYE